jgi:DNA polymerase III epsilon subunit-like protein
MVDWKAPDETSMQPHLVQLGMVLVETGSWKIMARHSLRVRLPEGASMDPGALAAHGIGAEECNDFGLDPSVVCQLFRATVLQADLIVAHNLRFDQIVMRAACARSGVELDWVDAVPGYCTMEGATAVLQLPGKKGYKWPTLAEAYTHFSGEELKGAHDAAVDAEACLRIYRSLVSPIRED